MHSTGKTAPMTREEEEAFLSPSTEIESVASDISDSEAVPHAKNLYTLLRPHQSFPPLFAHSSWAWHRENWYTISLEKKTLSILLLLATSIAATSLLTLAAVLLRSGGWKCGNHSGFCKYNPSFTHPHVLFLRYPCYCCALHKAKATQKLVH